MVAFVHQTPIASLSSSIRHHRVPTSILHILIRSLFLSLSLLISLHLANTLKVRMTLNYKKIPYTESFHTYPSIAALCQKLGIPANTETGSIKHTLPAIAHASIPGNLPTSSPTGGAMDDSLSIAYHLDQAFPDTPRVFPSLESWQLFQAAVAIMTPARPALARLIMPTVPAMLDHPQGSEYFLRTREAMFGKPVTEIGSKDREEDDWKPFLTALGQIAQIVRGPAAKLNVAGSSEAKGRFLVGDGLKPTYVDFYLVGLMAWMKRSGQDGDWARWMEADEGVWKGLWEACEPILNGMGEEKEWQE